MPGEAAKKLLREGAKRLKRASDDLLYPLLDEIDRSSMSPEEREKARQDPQFREDDDRFQEEVGKHQKRKMDEEKSKERRRSPAWISGVRG